MSQLILLQVTDAAGSSSSLSTRYVTVTRTLPGSGVTRDKPATVAPPPASLPYDIIAFQPTTSTSLVEEIVSR